MVRLPHHAVLRPRADAGRGAGRPARDDRGAGVPAALRRGRARRSAGRHAAATCARCCSTSCATTTSRERAAHRARRPRGGLAARPRRPDGARDARPSRAARSAVRAGDAAASCATRTRSIFDVIREGDLLVHHPFESFATTVERFLERGGARTSRCSRSSSRSTARRATRPIVRALIEAAQRGKQVAVLVELKARFDEANNITWARQLESAGVHVAFGVGRAQDAREDRRSSCGARPTASAATSTSAPATTTRARRGSTPTSACSPADPSIGADVSDLFNSSPASRASDSTASCSSRR